MSKHQDSKIRIIIGELPNSAQTSKQNLIGLLASFDGFRNGAAKLKIETECRMFGRKMWDSVSKRQQFGGSRCEN